MREENLLLLRALKQNIEEIIPPLDAAQLEIYGEKKESSLDMIMGEITMIVLLLTNADDNVSASELELINDMRHVVYGYGIPELSTNDYFELSEKFLNLYPKRRMTIDHLPASVRLLLSYDQKHDTEHANKARILFLQFAEALINVDKDQNHIEQIVFSNFRETLNNITKDS